jgi:hypothetical protein
MAAVGIAHKIGIVFEDGEIAMESLFAYFHLGIVEKVFQDPFPGFIINGHVLRAGAFRRGILWMTTSIEVEACTVFEENVEETFGGDQFLEEVAHDFFRRQSAPPL